MTRKLEELNLIDDFLMNQMVTDSVIGEEFSRLLLKIIFQRDIGPLTITAQKVMYGTDTDKHGVRLDVSLSERGRGIFDVEPDTNVADKDSLPRRVRFYHAKIDADVLQSGADYKNLQDVVVIFITNYDPFGYDRLLYTVKNRCMEEPDMPYDDGATTLFLYTKGTKGNYPEALKSLLHYMEYSTAENATTKELQEIHQMVGRVKKNPKVGVAYMKFHELMERERQEGYYSGEQEHRISQIIKKMKKEKTPEQIAEELEEEISAILEIYDVIKEMGTDCTPEEVYEKLKDKVYE